MTNISEQLLQERHPNTLKFMKMLLERKLSWDTIGKVSDMIHRQGSPSRAYQRILLVTDILEKSETEAEFLHKLEEIGSLEI